MWLTSASVTIVQKENSQYIYIYTAYHIFWICQPFTHPSVQRAWMYEKGVIPKIESIWVDLIRVNQHLHPWVNRGGRGQRIVEMSAPHRLNLDRIRCCAFKGIQDPFSDTLISRKLLRALQYCSIPIILMVPHRCQWVHSSLVRGRCLVFKGQARVSGDELKVNRWLDWLSDWNCCFRIVS